MFIFTILCTGFFIGACFIGLGYFVGKYPDTIAGYNTMSRQRKKSVDIDGLSTFLKKILIAVGIFIIVEFPVLYLLGAEQIAVILMISVPIVVIIIAVFRARKFDSYKKK